MTFLNIKSAIQIDNSANRGVFLYILTYDVRSTYANGCHWLTFHLIVEWWIVKAGLSFDNFYNAQLLNPPRHLTSNGADADHKRTHWNPRKLDLDLLFLSLPLAILNMSLFNTLVGSLEITCRTHVNDPTFTALFPTYVSNFKLTSVLPLDLVIFRQTTRSRPPRTHNVMRNTWTITSRNDIRIGLEKHLVMKAGARWTSRRLHLKAEDFG